MPKILAALTSGSTKLAALILDPLMGRFGVVPPPDGVLAEIAEACRLDPKDFALELKAAEYHSRAGKFDEALDYYRWVLENGPEGPAQADKLFISGNGATVNTGSNWRLSQHHRAKTHRKR